MELNYILSDLTKTATTECLKQVIKKAESNLNKNFIVIVPENKSIIIEKELLNLSSVGAFSNIFVYSFVRLLTKIGKIDENKIANKQTCIMILRKIVNDNLNKLVCYKKIAKATGFAENLYVTIEQFKSSNISVEDLKLALKSTNGALSSKLKDLILIYENYENKLGEVLFDDCDKLNLLSNLAKNNKSLKESDVFVVGFDSITPEMKNVLTDISANANSITFSCPYLEKNKPNLIFVEDNHLFKKFTEIGDKLHYSYNPKMFYSSKKDDFLVMQNNLFSNKMSKIKSKGNVSIFKAKNVRQEIDYVANTILDEVENGKRFNEIGVYACDISKTSKIIKDCFDSYGIPYFINEEHDITNCTLINFIKYCFELVVSNLDSNKLLMFCSSSFVNLPNYFEFENFIKATGLNHSEILNASSADENINRILTFIKSFYNDLKRLVDSAKTINDFLKIIEILFTKFDIQNKLLSISNFEKENGLIIESEISLAIFEKCEQFNKTLSNFMGEMQTTLAEFLQVYISGFQSLSLNLSPLSIDSVIIQNNTDGFYNIKDMFIVNAVQSVFPSKIQDSGMIVDSELDEINTILNKNIEPSTKEINLRETFKVFEALLEPKEKLFISFSDHAISGESNVPASVVCDIHKIFGDGILIDSYKSHIFANKSGFENRFAKHINLALNNKYDKKLLNQEYSILDKNISKELKNRLDDINKPLSKEFIKCAEQLYFKNNKTSISQLEKYFVCPYLFYVTYGLRLKENKDAKLSSLDIGTIIHRVAELFVKNISKFEQLDKFVFDEEINKLLKTIFNEFQINTNKNKALLNLICKEAKRLCNHLLEESQNSNFKSTTEFVFDNENAVELKIDKNHSIFIKGKIDRIDRCGDYIRIIDYKTGNVSNSLASIYFGEKIQLVSYLSALNIKENEKVAGLFYLPVHNEFVSDEEKSSELYKMSGYILDDIDAVKNMDKRLGGLTLESNLVPVKIKKQDNEIVINHNRQKNYLTQEEFNGIKNYNEKLCEQASKEILSGYIEPSPLKLETLPCEWCEFSKICGIENSKLVDGRKLDCQVDVNSFLGDEDGEN